jgi:hypothetical protein
MSDSDEIPHGSDRKRSDLQVGSLDLGAEFYGFSQYRQHEFDGVCKDLEIYYDNSVNDQSLNVTVICEGMLCVIRQCDKYYRVIIK